jgi:acetate kinase
MMGRAEMHHTVLAINAGSASLKSALFTFESHPRLITRDVTTTRDGSGVRDLVRRLSMQRRDAPLVAIGHRIVHGGPDYDTPRRITADVLAELKHLIPFAPNHLPAAIALIETVTAADPDLPQVACFDTAFHHQLPEVARRLPIPHQYDQRGVRRYGFHGLSYAYLLQELQRRAGADAAHGNVVIAHLGNGSSLAAIRGGRSIDTSMCFTPLGGVVMSTRSGDLDPGVIAFIARAEGLDADGVEQLFSHRSGLLAISAATGDMRELLERERTDPPSRLAVDIYSYQIKKWIGAFAAALGGLDTIVFSGGIGEHAPEVRRRICDGLEFLGVRLNHERNAANREVISAADSRVTVRMIPTDEELMIAQAAFEILGDPS